MRNATIPLRLVPASADPADPKAARLDSVFFALSDPVRRTILERLSEQAATVGTLAEPFGISLQAVSRHIQVLVAAGLVIQTRTGRISRCSLETGPILEATVWLSRYSKYWEAQFEGLKAALDLGGAQGNGTKRRKKRKPAKGDRT